MGEANYLFMTEKMETLRWLAYGKPSTVVMVDDITLNPPIVNLGEMEYPHDIEETLRNNFKIVYIIPASTMAADLGNARAANVVLMGAFSQLLDIEEEIWLTCLLARLPEKLHDLNKKAFAAGKQAI